jgi:hypothetical protein
MLSNAYCKSINFHCIQFSRFLSTEQIRGNFFRSTSLLADDVLYWQDKIVLHLSCEIWSLCFILTVS